MRKFEVVACVFKNCNFSTNIYSTFTTHRHRKHHSHSPEDFKTEVLQNQSSEPISAQDETYVEESSELLVGESQELSQDIKQRFGHLFLKLESTFNVPNKCIDEIVDELRFISTCASGPLLKDVVVSTLKNNNCDLDPSIHLCLIWSKIFVRHTLLVLPWGQMGHSQLCTRGENSKNTSQLLNPNTSLTRKRAKPSNMFHYCLLCCVS